VSGEINEILCDIPPISNEIFGLESQNRKHMGFMSWKMHARLFSRYIFHSADDEIQIKFVIFSD
jgi:hypothetical protein